MTSSCSEDLPRVAAEEIDPAARIVAFLSAVAGEVSDIAGGIVELGDKLSARAAHATGPMRHSDLQMFDLLGQNAQAQARLLTEIVRVLSEKEAAGHASLRCAVDTVPFHKARQKFHAVLDGTLGAADMIGLDESGEDTDWF